MPIAPSAIKRMRSDARKHSRNQSVLSEIKTIQKAFRNALADRPAEAKAGADRLISALDKAASKGIIPKGRANRLKSRASRALRKLTADPSKKKLF